MELQKTGLEREFAFVEWFKYMTASTFNNINVYNIINQPIRLQSSSVLFTGSNLRRSPLNCFV